MHFDGKTVTDYYGHSNEHRLAVTVTNPDQLLGVPEVKHECLIDVAEAVYDLLVE